MRLSFIALLLISNLAHAAPASVDAFAPVFELAGIRLLCEQSAPLLRRGLSERQQAQLGEAFAADALCLDLAKQLADRFDQAQLRQIQRLLGSPIAKRFSAVERAVGADGGEALTRYRVQLAQRPPRQDRMVLVRRLDAAAHTTSLAGLLRYEVGKTQALLALMARGETLDEQAMSEQTAGQASALMTSSAAAVESFMLYAYRQMPSAQLAEYTMLYEQPVVVQLLEGCTELLPGLFAERRTALRKAAAKR
ncbi:hypothetical protein PH586_11350 [Pseudomonas sp. SA3-5]|uniref:DUF2059 domain-containing protein n=1 Tax=Pseudomonas aestuarii TaxID=3018340 RepID=A0ABT4XFJ0_9PSED|nr:hypothetical protein [Pseudomonas aestuarii]MDA7086980.1 hypothetical protein [Pseudomonas aestuarii]